MAWGEMLRIGTSRFSSAAFIVGSLLTPGGLPGQTGRTDSQGLSQSVQAFRWRERIEGTLGTPHVRAATIPNSADRLQPLYGVTKGWARTREPVTRL